LAETAKTTSATIFRSIPPHRNSVELVNMAFAARGPKFILDSSWDQELPTHVEG
jgi:hypothetical protein